MNELPRGRASRYQLKDFFNSEAEPRGINRQPNKKFANFHHDYRNSVNQFLIQIGLKEGINADPHKRREEE